VLLLARYSNVRLWRMEDSLRVIAQASPRVSPERPLIVDFRHIFPYSFGEVEIILDGRE